MANSFSYPLHAFRGFAILNIVAIHAFVFVLLYAGGVEQPVGWPKAVLEIIIGILLHDSTLYFTYISGILFSMVLAERGYRQFFASKFNYVFLPYLVFTLLYSSFSMTGPPGSPLAWFDGSAVEFAKDAAYNLVTGMAIPTFWYIPVLLVLYLATPFLARLVASPRQVPLKALIILLPLVASRVWPDVSWTNYVYFLGAYLIGMMVGTNYEATVRLVGRYRWTLATVALISSIGVFLAGLPEVPTFGVTNLAESAWYIQKIALGGLVIYWFERSMQEVPGWLDVLGNYAFAIYFLHMGFILGLTAALGRYGVAMDDVREIVLWMAGMLLFALAGSSLVVYLVKLAIGKHSRYVLGS